MPLTPSQLAALRQDYALRGLHREDLHPDPVQQFGAWLAEAVAQQILEPNAMVLSSVDAAGQPWSRTVLLKACEAHGFTFFTSYTGAKAQQLADNARCALTFWWSGLERQVNIAGIATRTSAEESDAYFALRPLESRLGAWASSQSEVLANRAVLEARWEEARARFADGDVPRPEGWGGYCVEAHAIEFWQGRRSRLHDRFRYTRRSADDWKIERLAP